MPGICRQRCFFPPPLKFPPGPGRGPAGLCARLVPLRLFCIPPYHFLITPRRVRFHFLIRSSLFQSFSDWVVETGDLFSFPGRCKFGESMPRFSAWTMLLLRGRDSSIASLAALPARRLPNLECSPVEEVSFLSGPQAVVHPISPLVHIVKGWGKKLNTSAPHPSIFPHCPTPPPPPSLRCQHAPDSALSLLSQVGTTRDYDVFPSSFLASFIATCRPDSAGWFKRVFTALINRNEFGSLFHVWSLELCRASSRRMLAASYLPVSSIVDGK